MTTRIDLTIEGLHQLQERIDRQQLEGEDWAVVGALVSMLIARTVARQARLKAKAAGCRSHPDHEFARNAVLLKAARRQWLTSCRPVGRGFTCPPPPSPRGGAQGPALPDSAQDETCTQALRAG